MICFWFSSLCHFNDHGCPVKHIFEMQIARCKIGNGVVLDFTVAESQRIACFLQMKALLDPKKTEMVKAMQRGELKTIDELQIRIDETMCLWARSHCFQMSLLHELYRTYPANNAAPERWFSLLRCFRGYQKLRSKKDLVEYVVGVQDCLHYLRVVDVFRRMCIVFLFVSCVCCSDF